MTATTDPVAIHSFPPGKMYISSSSIINNNSINNNNINNNININNLNNNNAPTIAIMMPYP